MCTASVIALPGAAGFRLVISRDEERDRPPALWPRWHDVAPGLRAAWPVDPLGGGTWVAVTTDGLALCVLNGNPDPRPPRPEAERVLSRGMLIPAAAGARTPALACNVIAGLPLDRFPPFRFVACAADGARALVAEAVWDGRSLSMAQQRCGSVCFASSGLGDHRAAPRVPLFAEMVGPDPDAERQDRFHAHRWADRPEVSVWMDRPDARTVSVTRVTVERGRVELSYRPLAGAGDRPGEGPRHAAAAPAELVHITDAVRRPESARTGDHAGPAGRVGRPNPGTAPDGSGPPCG